MAGDKFGVSVEIEADTSGAKAGLKETGEVSVKAYKKIVEGTDKARKQVKKLREEFKKLAEFLPANITAKSVNYAAELKALGRIKRAEADIEVQRQKTKRSENKYDAQNLQSAASQARAEADIRVQKGKNKYIKQEIQLYREKKPLLEANNRLEQQKLAYRKQRDADNRSLAESVRKNQQMNSAMRGVARSVQIAGLAMGALAVAAVKMANEYNKSLTNIKALVGVSSESVDLFSEDLRELSSSVAKTSTELADGLYFVTSAGQRGSQAFKTLEIASKASAVGLGETKIVAGLMTSAIEAYGSANITAAEAADKLTAAIRLGKLEGHNLAPVMGRLLPMASELGVEFDELAGSIAYLSRIGLTASEATTVMRGTLAKLVRPTELAENAMKRWGITYEEVARTAEDEGLLDALLLIYEKAGSRQQLGKYFEDVEALNGILALVANNGENAREVIEGVSNAAGELDDAFRTTSSSTAFKVQQGLTDLKESMLSIGQVLLETLLPAFTTVAATIKKVVTVFASIPAPVKNAVIGITGISTAMLALIPVVKGAITVVTTFGIKLGLATGGISLLVGAISTFVGLALVKFLSDSAAEAERLATAASTIADQFDSMREYTSGVRGEARDLVKLSKEKELPQLLSLIHI